VYKVPYHDYAREYEIIRTQSDNVLHRVLARGKFRDGIETSAFEEEFKKYCEVHHVITTGSCQDAIFLSLLALGVGPGDEVITVANIPIACTAPIAHVGAKLKFADVEGRSHNLDPSQIESLVTSSTKVILVAHLYGHPADMDSILEISRRHGLRVIEDAATAVGATYKGRRVGTLGDLGCFSHAPSKILGTWGDGGTVITDSDELAAKIRELFIYRDTGRFIQVDGRPLHAGFHYRVEGYHTRMVELSCGILREKLRKLDTWIGRRREIANEYNVGLSELDIQIPEEEQGSRHVYRNYTIAAPHRDTIRIALARRGIETGLQYCPPLNLQPVYASLGLTRGSLPTTEKLAGELINLPMYQELTDQQVGLVIREVQDVVSEVRNDEHDKN